MLTREGHEKLAQACFEFLSVRVELGVAAGPMSTPSPIRGRSLRAPPVAI